MFYCSLLFALTISCVHLEMSEIESFPVGNGSSSFFLNASNDTLVFTSGIRSILHDSKGNYWIGSHQEGVARFDGSSFTYFTVEDGLCNNQVRRIQEDSEGTIWFGTGDGVSSYDGKAMYSFDTKELVSNTQGPRIMESVEIDDLWFNTRDQNGFYGFDGEKLRFQPFPLEDYSDSQGRFAFQATGFSKTRVDYGWIATYSAVFGFDGEVFERIDDRYLEFYEGIGGRLHVRSVLEDSKGNLWIGNNGIGVLLLDGNNVINFSNKKGLTHPESAGGGAQSPAETMEHVFAISEDKDGNIWFGDRDTGAWRYDGKKMTNFTIDPNLESQMIWQIYQDENGDLLFAMASGGVYEFNGTSFDRKF